MINSLEISKKYDCYDYFVSYICWVQYEEIASSSALQLKNDALLIKLLEKIWYKKYGGWDDL